MGVFMNISENILCALIGVFGTVVGTIIGLVIPHLLNNIGKKRLTVSNVDAKFDTGEPDNVGGFFGSWLYFTITIINKKNKNLIIENASCELYNGNTLIQTFSCLDKDSHKKIAQRNTYDEIIYIDVLPKSSIRKNVYVPVGGNLTVCDKVVFKYSWGILKRKDVIWTKTTSDY